MKQIIICADDYGQNKEISQGIIELIQQKRLSATSCLTTSPDWPTAAQALLPFKHHVDLGLHFNLTEGKPLSQSLASFEPLNSLIVDSQLRTLSLPPLIDELNAQLDQFIEQIGYIPDFIDGHQHVHQFPMIRDALLTVYEKRLANTSTYLRCTYQNPMEHKNFTAKQFMINLCGGFAFKKILIQKNIPHNHSFSGIYNFNQAKRYPQLFSRFLAASSNKGIIMCHPGKKSADPQDPIVQSRQHELNYFLSDAFLFSLQESHTVLARFHEGAL